MKEHNFNRNLVESGMSEQRELENGSRSSPADADTASTSSSTGPGPVGETKYLGKRELKESMSCSPLPFLETQDDESGLWLCNEVAPDASSEGGLTNPVLQQLMMQPSLMGADIAKIDTSS